METQLAEAENFINQIDDRLNSFVTNIDLSPDKNLDKLQVFSKSTVYVNFSDRLRF